MLLRTLAASSIVGNALLREGVIRAGEGKNKPGQDF